ncbi:MAG: type II toxin-antitoxin system RelE/ParE family toxin [Candidatus Scalindua sp.]
MLFELKEYIDINGRNNFETWFNRLNTGAALKVRKYLARLENANFSRVESVGSGVQECKIDFGPGYRVYFGKDGENLIILLAGGTKKRQQNDIKKARDLYGKNIRNE